jgi:tRNA G18 (ribose-2'-O)-methylase SpoU
MFYQTLSGTAWSVSLIDMYLILHNIRSAYNVGAIFRTADATGVRRIYLTGYTPTPIDRFGRVQAEISKTSLGASESVPWEHDTLPAVITMLQTKHVQVVAVEQASNSIPLAEFTADGPVAYVFGNEVTGLAPDALQAVNAIVELPMLGTKESLNVSVAAGVVMYHEIFTHR